MNTWFFVQKYDGYVDFDKEVLSVCDEGNTTLDVRLAFETKTRQAWMTVAWHNDDGRTMDLGDSRELPWEAALEMIALDVPAQIFAELKAVTLDSAPSAQVAEALSEMMDKWNKLERCVRHLFPDATDEEIYSKTKAAMDLALQTVMERSTH